MLPPDNAPTLHLFCGKPASGKSTLADRYAERPGSILLREDRWLSGLYGDQMSTLTDFVRCSALLRKTITPHAVALLQSGLSVVLDFHANTKESRQWMLALVEKAGCGHELHFLDVPDEVCKTRLRQRNLFGEHEFSVTEAEFDRIASHFQPPTEDEPFNLKIHSAGDQASGKNEGRI
ncbi:ATP-binding protein [Roseibium sp. FZY0029]|uniref:AAA family ATPase n=1 Tax=Roseibium sp. FZY0029 TaxID=3116647 RepID=UPI002EA5C63D|nr:ATP-binding protein [Roseibium sp. FZY0029]